MGGMPRAPRHRVDPVWRRFLAIAFSVLAAAWLAIAIGATVTGGMNLVLAWCAAALWTCLALAQWFLDRRTRRGEQRPGH